MMPDLGKYAAPVLSAYGVSLVLLLLLVVFVVRRSRKARQDLEKVENG